MIEILLTSIIAFISTNIDDIFLLTLFFGNRQFRQDEIIAGQLLGIFTLIIISLAGSLIGLIIDQSWIGLLGLFPVYLGVRGIFQHFKKDNEDNSDTAATAIKRKNKTLAVAGVTIANGGDNIGIYVPLFATITWPDKLTMVVIFLLMTVLWCLIAKYFTSHLYVAKIVDKYGHIVTPYVLILLGLFILYEAGTFSLLV